MTISGNTPPKKPEFHTPNKSGDNSANGQGEEYKERRQISPVSEKQKAGLHTPIDLEFEAPKNGTLGFRISQIPTLDFQTSTRTVTLDEAAQYILNLPKTDPDYLGFSLLKDGNYSTLTFPSRKPGFNNEREVRFHFGELRKSYEGNPRFLIGVNRSCFLYDGEGSLKQGNAYTILPAN